MKENIKSEDFFITKRAFDGLKDENKAIWQKIVSYFPAPQVQSALNRADETMDTITRTESRVLGLIDSQIKKQVQNEISVEMWNRIIFALGVADDESILPVDETTFELLDIIERLAGWDSVLKNKIEELRKQLKESMEYYPFEKKENERTGDGDS